MCLTPSFGLRRNGTRSSTHARVADYSSHTVDLPPPPVLGYPRPLSRQFGEQRREEGRGEGSLKRETGGGGGLDRRSSYTVYLQIWLRESGATRCWALAEDRYWNLCPWVDAPLRQATQGLGPFPREGACINNTRNFGYKMNQF